MLIIQLGLTRVVGCNIKIVDLANFGLIIAATCSSHSVTVRDAVVSSLQVSVDKFCYDQNGAATQHRKICHILNEQKSNHAAVNLLPVMILMFNI